MPLQARAALLSMPFPARAVLLSTLLAVGCAPPAPPAPPTTPATTSTTITTTTPLGCIYPTLPPAAPVLAYRYRVAAAPRGDELCVEVDLPHPSSTPQRWSPEGPLRPFVRDVALAQGGGFDALPLTDGAWQVPACAAAGGCRLRYRLLLAEAARDLGDHDYAEEHRGAVLAPPSSWMLRPMRAQAPFQLTVSMPPGVGFVTGLSRSAESEQAYAGDIGALDNTPYAAFGALSIRALALPGGTLDVALAPATLTAGLRAAVDAWIDSAAHAMAAYFGRFPIPRAALIVKIETGSRIGNGHTMGNGGGAVLISVGERSTPEVFAEDWVLVHEMVHLSFPDVGRPWAEEGLATYLEPLIRTRAGLLSEDEVWRGMIEDMPKGQPRAGEGGLDQTDTWGRRYWGGALFWLAGDVEIRERTGNRRSLDDVLRAVSRAGGNVAVRWDLDRVLAMGDEAAGVDVLRTLRKRLGGAPGEVDLRGLWKRLGVSIKGRRVVYDEGAELAAIRRSMTARGTVAPRL